MDRPFCPILKGECVGKNCAMVVKLDHPNISAYNKYWVCGLVASHDTIKHGTVQIIDSWSRYE